MTFFRLVLFITCYLTFVIPFSIHANPTGKSLESFINEQVGTYPFSPDNRFKLSAYAEMKGRYSSETQAFVLDFAGLGSISFFEQNCLLKTHNQRLILKRYELNPIHAGVMNQALHDIFEQISLLGNHKASPAHIEFVNKWLARKNLEPFDKIYTRHILLRFGRYNPKAQHVEFHTDWIPERYGVKATNAADAALIKKHINRLRIRLDSLGLRGYYVDAGGEVFVDDVDRSVIYATGEEYGYNVSAFKLFIQKLFIQSVQYVAQWDNNKRKVVRKAKGMAAKPLYTHQSWIPMMLSLLRTNDINIGDPDVICYFVDEPYYSTIYEQMTVDERSLADHFVASREPSTEETEFSQVSP